MVSDKTVSINGTPCRIRLARYEATGQLGMQLVVAETNEATGMYAGTPYGMPSYHDEAIELGPDEMICKDDSEYVGYPEAFVDQGLAVLTEKHSPSYGFPVLRFLFEVPAANGPAHVAKPTAE